MCFSHKCRCYPSSGGMWFSVVVVGPPVSVTKAKKASRKSDGILRVTLAGFTCEWEETRWKQLGSPSTSNFHPEHTACVPEHFPRFRSRKGILSRAPVNRDAPITLVCAYQPQGLCSVLVRQLDRPTLNEAGSTWCSLTLVMIFFTVVNDLDD